MERLEGQRPIDAHPDGDKEKAEEKDVKWLNIAFDLMAKLRFRQKDARNERAKRHGQASPFHH